MASKALSKLAVRMGTLFATMSSMGMDIPYSTGGVELKSSSSRERTDSGKFVVRLCKKGIHYLDVNNPDQLNVLRQDATIFKSYTEAKAAADKYGGKVVK